MDLPPPLAPEEDPEEDPEDNQEDEEVLGDYDFYYDGYQNLDPFQVDSYKEVIKDLHWTGRKVKEILTELQQVYGARFGHSPNFTESAVLKRNLKHGG
jgi:hypothetical protein